jgi:hypothetical protein
VRHTEVNATCEKCKKCTIYKHFLKVIASNCADSGSARNELGEMAVALRHAADSLGAQRAVFHNCADAVSQSKA